MTKFQDQIILCISYHMDQMIWTISYGVYHMSHIIWVIWPKMTPERWMHIWFLNYFFYYLIKCIFTGYKKGFDFDSKKSFRLYTVYCSQVRVLGHNPEFGPTPFLALGSHVQLPVGVQVITLVGKLSLDSLGSVYKNPIWATRMIDPISSICSKIKYFDIFVNFNNLILTF